MAAAARVGFVAGPRQHRAVAMVIGVIGVIGFEGGRCDQHRPGPNPRQLLPAEPLEHIHCDSLYRRSRNHDGGNEIAGPHDRPRQAISASATAMTGMRRTMLRTWLRTGGGRGGERPFIGVVHIPPQCPLSCVFTGWQRRVSGSGRSAYELIA
ncbi:hypothetical protein MGAST_11210 [Mycobacterium gastri 'Wayne']|uniref:Uncharacterized protein n=1 Tax=Mycobacterium gastri TaxID=1777 RepID=A0A1X1UQ23_MYCGS|nr:hypothetical protein MGAST_11210 [Mycobacterium gastri 'Wayne']ORV58841.1 hypothetical protein AWC07_20190 [Mycobacterium gastri]